MKTEDKECLPCREKYWIELSDSEKIERMREIVKSQKRIIERMDVCLAKLEKHYHQNYQILIRYDHDSNTTMHSYTPRRIPLDDNYF